MIFTFRSVVAGLLVVVATTACSESDADAGSGAEGYRIGAVLDITGPGASLGAAQRDTLELLVDELNKSGGIDGENVELVIEDNESTEEGAVRATEQLINEEGVALLLGASRTGPSLAMRPIAEDAEVPMISLASNSAIVEDSKWVFKTAQNDSVALERMVSYAEEQGWNSLGVMRDSSGLGEGVTETLTELATAAGVEVVADEKFAPDATDFTAQVVRLRNAGADANIIWGVVPASPLAQRAYDAIGPDSPVMHSHGVSNAQFLEAADGSAEGIIVPASRLLVPDELPADHPQHGAVAQFTELVQDRTGEAPSAFAGYAHDAFALAVDALEAEGPDREALRNHLEGVQDFVGVTGVYSFSEGDHAGLGQDAMVMVTVKDGGWSLLEGDAL
jgi:branched-chain amino acid transport system substrate-binding protein